MKQICLLIACCLAGTVGFGREMTLAECIETGINRNLTLANARIEIHKGRTGVQQSRSRLLPVIQGMFQLTDNLQDPVNVTTGTLLGTDFPEHPTWQAIKSMPYNARAGVQFAMPLYDQTLLAAREVARTVEQLNSLAYEQAVEELTVQISRVYYLAQASQEQVRLTEENMARMEELCDITAALFSQGVVKEVDLERVRISLQNLKAQRDQSVTQHGCRLNLLRYLMDWPPEEPLDVTVQGEELGLMPLVGFCEAQPEWHMAQKQQTLAEQRLRTVKAGYLPSVALTGYAGTMGYREKFGHFFHSHSPRDRWFGNSYIALTVKVPLFEANARKLQIRQHRDEARQAANRAEQVKKQLRKGYDDALMQLNCHVEAYRTQTENRRQAEKVYDVTAEQYKEGVASMTDLLQDEMQLRTVQSACVQALCQCRLAQLDLLKLSGRLTQLKAGVEN